MIEKDSKTTKQLLWIIGTVVMALYIGVKDVAAPLIKNLQGVSERKLTDMVDLDSQRITRLEANVSRLDSIPERVATQTEAILGLKLAVEKMERKLDDHIITKR